MKLGLPRCFEIEFIIITNVFYFLKGSPEFQQVHAIKYYSSKKVYDTKFTKKTFLGGGGWEWRIFFLCLEILYDLWLSCIKSLY